MDTLSGLYSDEEFASTAFVLARTRRIANLVYELDGEHQREQSAQSPYLGAVIQPVHKMSKRIRCDLCIGI